jgi:hypothetical protein
LPHSNGQNPVKSGRIGRKMMILRSINPSEHALEQREWRARRRASLRQRCECCGKTFVPSRVSAVYCGQRCNKRAYERRKAQERRLQKAGGVGEAPIPRSHAPPWREKTPPRPAPPPVAPPVPPVAVPEPGMSVWSAGRRIDLNALIG